MADEELSQEQRAQLARAMSLYARWLKGGQLSLPQLREVRPQLGEENYARALALLGVEENDAAISETVEVDRVWSGPELQNFVPTYGRSVRQMKRWIATGRAAKKPELPPLERPDLMRDWWTRHMTQRCPAKIVQAAIDVARNPTTPAEPGASGSAGKSIDVKQLEMVSGQAVLQANRFLAATANALEAAYLDGNDAEIDRLQKRWDKALNAVRLAESSERAARKQDGDLIPKAVLFPELSTYLEVQRVMRSTMARKVCSSLADLSDEIRERVASAIEKQRAPEESILRRLPQFRSIEEIELELTAA